MQNQDIADLVDRKNIECYNESVAHRVCNILDKNDLFVESDVGHAMLIHIPFTSHVRLASVVLTCFGDGSCPKDLHVFVNKPLLTLDEAESMKPTQAVKIDQAAAAKGMNLPLRMVLFQDVSCLSLYVQSNHGGENTRIKTIQFTGSVRGSLNMADFKKTG